MKIFIFTVSERGKPLEQANKNLKSDQQKLSKSEEIEIYVYPTDAGRISP